MRPAPCSAPSGYGNTTIRQIAEAAGVAADTVYDTFGTKARVLTALIDSRLAPPARATSSIARRRWRCGTNRTSGARSGCSLATSPPSPPGSGRCSRCFGRPSAVEPEIAPIYAEMENYRAANMRQAAEWIAANGELRVTTERAGEIIWALASPDVARLFCDTRGWSNDEYAAWLEDSLVRILLPEVALEQRHEEP